MQLNSKFVNNMLPEWGRFVTAVKLKRGLKTSNYDQLYAYLKQHEVQANENKMMLERYTQHAIDPLDFVSNVSLQQYPTQSLAILQFGYVPPVTYQPQFANNTQLDSGLTPTDDLIELKQLPFLPNPIKHTFLKLKSNSELHLTQETKP
nr:integrase, catalytic region, zinc finger, CCHC-type, peptidase aspartic, catalytic [Tanacetum cinerariifolium]